MIHFYLPGFSTNNSTFALQFAKKFRKTGMTGYARHWQHWEELIGASSQPGELATRSIQAAQGHLAISADVKPFDFAAEVARTEQVIKGIGKSELGIIAKSVGNLVASKLNLHKAQLTYLILMGLPVNSLSDTERSEWFGFINGVDCPVYLIQNTQDPLGSAASLQELLIARGIEVPRVELTKGELPYTEGELPLTEGKLALTKGKLAFTWNPQTTPPQHITLLCPESADHKYENIELLVDLARLFDPKDKLAV